MAAISSLLDCYFEVRRSPITDTVLLSMQRKISTMKTHFISLNQLMKQMAGKVITLPNSRKLHAIGCNLIPFLKAFGQVLKADTTSYESVHRFMTVAIWHMTSKKNISMYEEMANQSIELTYASTIEFLEAVQKNEIHKYIKRRGPPTSPEEATITAITNLKSWKLTFSNAENELVCHDHSLDSILRPSSTAVNEFTTGFTQYCEEEWPGITR